jgi:hypothetical protein
MENSAQGSALGTLGRRVIAWVVLLFVAVIAIKIAIGIVAGLVQAVVLLALGVVAVVGVLWALRHL